MQGLALRTNVRTALADNQALNRCLAPWTRLTGTPKHPQLVPVATFPAADGVKVSLTRTQGGTQITDSLPKCFANGAMQVSDFIG